MKKGTTTSGFSYEIEEDALDDYELLEIMKKVDDGDTGAMVDVVERLLGEEQTKQLKDHVRNERGRVSARKLFEEVSEILNSNDDGKNS